MAEKAPAPHGPEHKISVETRGEHAPSLERPTSHEKTSTGEKQHNVEAIQKNIEAEARSREEIQVGHQEAESKPAVIGEQRALKAEAYKGALRNLQSRLPPADRTFSKVIHQPTIETLSTAAAATVGRSSGLMGGGLLALLGSGFVLFMGKYYGFEYNFTVFIATFLGGFILGILIETLWRMLKGKPQPTN